MSGQTLLGDRAILVEADNHAEARGTLSAIEFSHLDFSAVRAFAVTAPDGAVRGGHAHRRGRQILMRVAGAIDVELRLDGAREHLRLTAETPALFIDRGVWSRLTYRGDDASLVALCDTPYEPADYYNDEA